MDYKNEFNSDDDFDCSNSYSDSYNGTNSSGQGQISNPHGLSKAELRKTNKPIMEKRRRARINHCLNELKSLILEAMKKDPARHTKLEKADILEMTVKHLQSVQRQQLNMAIQTDPTVVHKFKIGFMECAEEVNRYINQLDGVDVMVRQRLTNHLNNCATNLEQLGSMTNFNNGYRGQVAMGMSAPNSLFGATLAANSLSMASGTVSSTLFPPLPQDLNNNSNSGSSVGGGGVGGFINNINITTPSMPPVQMGGVQLIPSRLPSGEFALIMPSTHANILNNNSPASTNNNNNININNNNNTITPFVNVPHVRNITSAAISPNAIANTATTTTPTVASILAHPNIPINDFAANYKRMSAFSRPPAAPTKILANVPTINNIVSNKNTNNIHFSMPKDVQQPQLQQIQQQRPAPAHQLHHNSSTTTNSPPLSPISSLSSHGDDSLMHTSSDFTGSRPTTPPLDVTGDHQLHPNFSGVFSTPTSAATSSHSSAPPLHLQQQQVSSTSGSSANSSCNTSTCSNNNNSSTNDCSDSGVSLNTSLKRSLDEEADSSDAVELPVNKKLVLESKIQNENVNDMRLVVEGQREVLVRQKHKLQDLQEDRDNMWRPW